MEQARINYLIDRYITRQLTEGERKELLRLLSLPRHEGMLGALVERMKTEAAVPAIVGQQQTMQLFQKIMSADKLYAVQSLKDEEAIPAPKTPVHRTSLRRSWWAAAAVLLLVSTATWFLYPRTTGPGNHTIATQKPDRPPGTTGAVLTLADGRQVVLDSLGGGVVAYQNGVAVVLENGQLAYEANGSSGAETIYNTMTTPKGRQFMLVLHDGTRVWLNSASSLRYPASFSGSERRVSITGEAYFEVVKDAARPFRVTVDGKAEVEVIGTHFNINAYEDEVALKTTLLEGAIKMLPVALPSSAVVLKPGQQAQLSQAQINVVDDVDVSSVVAWKDGRFNFEGMPLTAVMKQLERWYDIDVVYEGTMPDVEFYGELSRSNTLAQILEAFKDAEIRCRLEGRKLVVLK
jgi:transmembrane sensor